MCYSISVSFVTWPRDLNVRIYKHTKGLNDFEEIGNW